ncbi:hypothetical protein [Trebonia kvetii]|uniref:hypothetical protein n=1 Tax=Trebonia kvetii TaxID=2480626 RepID=UPI001651D861|nr:hypothetical protein [Trebonia kvetii]
MREPLGIYRRVQDEGAEPGDGLRVPGTAVPLELIDPGIVLGDGRGVCIGGLGVGGALLCQLPASVRFCGRVLLDSPVVGGAGSLQLALETGPAAEDLA